MYFFYSIFNFTLKSAMLISLFRKELSATPIQSYPGVYPGLSDREGQGLTGFHKDLPARVNGQLYQAFNLSCITNNCLL
jgi:hypothetical protein